MIVITEKPINNEEFLERVRKHTNGAIVMFLGTVRDLPPPKHLQYMEYDAYTEMAERKLQQIVDEVQEKYHLEDVAIGHRIGRLELGETSLIVTVGAPHRAEAFKASQYIVERIKQLTPIWKKEVDEEGKGEWVKGYVPPSER